MLCAGYSQQSVQTFYYKDYKCKLEIFGNTDCITGVRNFRD